MSQRLQIRWKARWRQPSEPSLSFLGVPQTPVVPFVAAVLQVPQVRRKTRFVHQKSIHAEFPETYFGTPRVSHPAFVTRTHKARKLQVARTLPWVPTSAPDEQPLPAWDLTRVLKRHSTAFDTLRVTLAEFPATPAVPSAEEYPSWALTIALRRPQTRFTLIGTPHPAEYPVTPQTVEARTPQSPFTTRYHSARKRQIALVPPVYPETPPPPTAEGFPAWFKQTTLKPIGVRVKHMAKPGGVAQADALTAEGYPAWAPQNVHKRTGARFARLTQELNEYPETPITGTPEEYPSWLNPKAIRRESTAFRIIKSPHPAEYPTTPEPEGAEFAGNSGFVTRYHKSRKRVVQPFVIPADTVEPPDVPYPSWVPHPSFRVKPTYRLHRSGGGAVPANPAQPHTARTTLRAIYRKSTVFNLRVAIYPPVYPPPPPPPPAEYPSWQKPDAGIRRGRTQFTPLQAPFAPGYPSTPLVVTDVLEATRTLQRRATAFKIQDVTEAHILALNPPPAPPIYPSWIKANPGIRRRRPLYEVQYVPHPPVYPVALVPAVYPSFIRLEAIYRKPTLFELRTVPPGALADTTASYLEGHIDITCATRTISITIEDLETITITDKDGEEL